MDDDTLMMMIMSSLLAETAKTTTYFFFYNAYKRYFHSEHLQSAHSKAEDRIHLASY